MQTFKNVLYFHQLNTIQSNSKNGFDQKCSIVVEFFVPQNDKSGEKLTIALSGIEVIFSCWIISRVVCNPLKGCSFQRDI